MPTSRIPVDRVLSRLDDYLHKNDYAAATRHLLYWLSEAETSRDCVAELPIRNELMGLYRKLGCREDALAMANTAKERIDSWKIGDNVGAATTYLNCATVYKAFGMAKDALPLFEKARTIYENSLTDSDPRLAGLYNNMALALVDLSRFREADELYEKAISIMEHTENGSLEVAITYLNLASAREAELGLEDAAEAIAAYAKKAEELLEACEKRNGYYAFVCEKCASVFDYYGYFAYARELKDRARRIYEGT